MPQPASAELLLEVGAEELPASAVAKAQRDLRDSISAALAELGLAAVPVEEGYATPRRLIVAFRDVPTRQSDSVKRSRGPAVKGAYDESGAPTKALLGFCRGQGIEPDALENDGQYVWANVPVPGRATIDLLAEVLPKAILGLAFEKSMRWGASRLRFARPLRWILAAFDGEPVSFSIEGLRSGVESRGHRFYAPEAFEARSLEALVAGLRERKTEPSPEGRRGMILEGIQSLAGDRAEVSDALLDENVHLTEWPTAIVGEFPERYLDLPEPVLTVAMAKHERMFPVRRPDGTLDNRFVFIRNAGEDETVRRGAEWVLAARLQDARFFADEDAKSDMDGFLAKTEGILFQAKLGSVRARADRLAGLAATIAEATGGTIAEIEFARQAGLYAKADLATGLVSELPSLQGVIGGAYATQHGLPPEVARAIAGQYGVPAGPFNDAGSRTEARLVMADALDKLAGYLGLGLEPTGSSDPYGLRRSVTTLIEIALAWPEPLPSYEELLRVSLRLYLDEGHDLAIEGAVKAMTELFEARYGVVLEGTRYDVLDAALLRGYREASTLPQGVAFRVGLLTRLADDHALVQTATRPMNIVIAARRKGVAYAWEDPLAAVDLTALDSEEGTKLHALLKSGEEPAFRAALERDDAELERRLRSLQEPINAFFEATMIMAEDPDARYARLSLSHAVALQLLHAGDFTKLVVEG